MENNLENNIENNMVKVHTTKDFAISIAVIIIGVGIIFWITAIGIVIVLVGLLMLLVYKSGYKLNNQGAILKKKSVELSRKCRQAVMEALDGKNSNPELVEGNEGGTILLEVWYNNDENVGFAQLSDFQDYNFQKTTQIIELDPLITKNLLSKI